MTDMIHVRYRIKQLIFKVCIWAFLTCPGMKYVRFTKKSCNTRLTWKRYWKFKIICLLSWFDYIELSYYTFCNVLIKWFEAHYSFSMRLFMPSGVWVVSMKESLVIFSVNGIPVFWAANPNTVAACQSPLCGTFSSALIHS